MDASCSGRLTFRHSGNRRSDGRIYAAGATIWSASHRIEFRISMINIFDLDFRFGFWSSKMTWERRVGIENNQEPKLWEFASQNSRLLKKCDFYNCGPAATSRLPSSSSVYLAKLSMNRLARSFAFSSHTDFCSYVSRGSSTAGFTPCSSVGTSRLK